MAMKCHEKASVPRVLMEVGHPFAVGIDPETKPGRCRCSEGTRGPVRNRDGDRDRDGDRHRDGAPRVAASLAWLLVGCVLLFLGGCVTEPPPPPDLSRAERVVVKKAERKMQLIQGGQVVREYRIALGDQPRGHKTREGDERTPEGRYILDWRNPNSRFHKSIHVSYPNPRDKQLARYMGVDPGGMIMIHGQPNYLQSAKLKSEYQYRDWTNGCIAVQNHEMDEIWNAVHDGTPIDILP